MRVEVSCDWAPEECSALAAWIIEGHDGTAVACLDHLPMAEHELAPATVMAISFLCEHQAARFALVEALTQATEPPR